MKKSANCDISTYLYCGLGKTNSELGQQDLQAEGKTWSKFVFRLMALHRRRTVSISRCLFACEQTLLVWVSSGETSLPNVVRSVMRGVRKLARAPKRKAIAAHECETQTLEPHRLYIYLLEWSLNKFMSEIGTA